eukprot:Skav207417  [mRNA]  locus=scaffold646:162217:162492:+ [translate_table: standard]
MGSGASQPTQKRGEFSVAEDILGSETTSRSRSQRVTSLEIDDTIRTAAKIAVLGKGAQRSTRVTSLDVEDLGMNVQTTDSPVAHTESGSQS